MTPVSTDRGQLADLAARAREFVTLREAEAGIGRVSPEDEATIAAHVKRAARKAHAAEALAGGGAPAEGLRLAAEAVEAAEAALGARAATGAPPDGELVALVTEVRAALTAATLPAADEEVSARDAALHDRALYAVRAVQAYFAAAGSRTALARTRRGRKLLAGVVALTAIVAITSSALRRPALIARASANYDGAHNARYAFDDNPETEWLLPEGTATGWIELELPRAGARRLRLLNGHNPGFNDRGVVGWRVEAYARDRLVRTRVGAFVFSETPEWVVLELDAPQATRVRFVVLSVHRLGSALAEMNVDGW